MILEKEGDCMIIAETHDLKKTYEMGNQKTHALNGLDIAIEEGEFIAIVGASGSGKSTLLNMLGALDTPTSGQIIVRRTDLSKLSKDEQTIFRRRNIGFVFQNYNLIHVLNVYENIILPMKLDGRTVEQEFVNMLIDTLGLTDKAYQMPSTLSGGQQQRVAIARALITRPAIVLADEPTGNLDSKTGMEVISLMKNLSQRFHQTLVVVTHNDEIALLADRIIRIEDGKIVREGHPVWE